MTQRKAANIRGSPFFSVSSVPHLCYLCVNAVTSLYLTPLNGVRETREIEVLHLDRSNDNRPTRLGACQPDRAPNRLELIEHKQWRLIETEILYRLRDFSFLDEELPVSA